MLKKIVVFLVLVVTICRSKIQISILTASNKKELVLSYSGEDNKIITEMDINLFNITDDNLKRGVRVELGKIPDDVFLKNPTPYKNLYTRYNWTQVNRSIRVKNVKVIAIVNQNVSLKKHVIINNTTAIIKEKAGLITDLENTICSSWNPGGLPETNVIYNVNVTFGKNSFTYENKWRNNSFHSVTLPFGVSKIGHIYIESGKAAIIELQAVKTILLLKIEYSARLKGSVIANYSKLYGKYHFWAPSVANIMKAAKLRNEIVTTEFLEIRCYLDPTLKIVDKNTLAPIHVQRSPKLFFVRNWKKQ